MLKNIWVDSKQVKCRNQMWFELWHFIFVSFGQTFCRTLWYFGMNPRDIMVHMIIHNNLKESQVLSQKKANYAGFSCQTHLCMDKERSEAPQIKIKALYPNENLLKLKKKLIFMVYVLL